MAPTDSAAFSGRAGSITWAASDCTTIKLTWWATMSCTSLDIRSRSAAAARQASSWRCRCSRVARSSSSAV